MPKVEPITVAVIGCGGISEIYLKNMTSMFAILRVKGCSDLIPERSQKRAEQFHIRQMTNEEIFQDPEIQIVVNLTYPESHYAVTKAAILAGKHVYSEKMMAVTWEEGKELYQLAQNHHVRLGLAPDTFLGAGYQTVRKYIDSGIIGIPMYAHALVVRNYQHRWEAPDPYQPFIMMNGGGIPFDMGGYYLHAMINLFGSIKRVSGFSKQLYADYLHLNPKHERYKESVHLETPTLLSGSLEFENGTLGSLTTISDGFGETSKLEIYGTNGNLICHDPNLYGESIFLEPQGDQMSRFEIPFTHAFAHGNYRGLGVADMAWGIVNNRPHRCSAELGLHAFETVHGIIRSHSDNMVYQMTTRCDRPQPLPSGYCLAGTSEGSLDCS